jgi:photosystem II stability/assembly factor-like uncharacterized protein
MNVYSYRALLRVLLFTLITIAIALLAFSSHGAKVDEPGVKPESQRGGSLVTPARSEGESRAAIDKNYGSLPLSFEANRGQTDASVKYVARGPGYNIFLTPAEAVFVLRDAALKPDQVRGEDAEGGNGIRSRPSRSEGETAGPTTPVKTNAAVLRVRLEGANINASALEGTEELPGKVNYFIGNDSSKWLTDIPTYSKVVYRDAYQGVDLVYYGNRQQLEYDFVVAPGADASVVALKYEGAESIRVDGEGNLVVKTPAGDLRQLKPVIYQEINGARKLIDGRYLMRGKNRVGFRVSSYDRSKPLVIDPILVYSSIVNAGGFGYAIAVDSSGFAYIAGATYEDLNATAGAFQTVLTGGYASFVTKLNQTGTGVMYTTYLGGNGLSEALGLAIDSGGNAYVTGYVSGTFPTTVGSYQPALASEFDSFVTKLNPTGSALVYSTFYGGNDFEEGVAITVDGAGNAYVIGDSSSRNLVTTPGAVQTTNGGGADQFVIRLNPSGSSLGYATYLGGGGSEIALGLALDSANNIYVGGETSSFNYPQVNSLQGSGGVNRGLFRSTNNGTSWSLSNNGLPNSQVTAFAFNPTTPTTMYAGTIGGVSKSTNGGATWVDTAPTTRTVRAIAIDPTNANTVYAGTANGVFKTTNGGTSWTLINNGFASGVTISSIAVRTLAIDPTNPATIFAGTSLGLYRTTNGGTNWTRIGTATGLTNESFWAIVYDPVTPTTIYAGTNSAGVFKSTNSGANWTVMNAGLTSSSSRSIRSMAIVPNSPATLYIGTLTGIFKTTDGGTSWNAASNGLVVPHTDSLPRLPSSVNAIVIDPVTPSTLYAGSSGTVIFTGVFPLMSISKSTDSGANWTTVTNGFGTLNNGILALAINPSDPSMLYAGTAGDFDGYVTKINASGTSLNYSTYVSSSRNDFVASIVADATGNCYVFGGTAGPNLPVTAGAFDSTLNGSFDTFVTKLNPSGTARLYSTYLGGSNSDDAYGIAIDSAGSAYLVGATNSTDFPVTNGAFQSTIGDRGTFGTYDAFVTKLNATGTALVYSSYLGGLFDEMFDFEGNNLALDPLGNVYIVGGTGDPNSFPAFNYANAFSPQFGPSTTFVVKIEGNTPSYSITGTLTGAGGVPLEGVYVEAENAQGFWRVGRTTFDGTYAITSLPAGNYTVTPEKFNATGTAHYIFTPASRTFNSLNSNQTANFAGTEVFDIQGRVTSSTVPGLGVFDVTISLNGAASNTTTTDANGYFTLRDLLPGNYTVTPLKIGFTFDPTNFVLNNLNANQFLNITTASTTFYTVSGRAADASNVGISNATITMLSKPPSGDRSVSVQTDADGNYSFANLQAGGNYTFKASKTDRSFAPPSATFNNLSGNQTQNFTASAAVIQSTLKTWTISGRTYVYVKLSFPNAGISVANWGTIFRNVNDFESSITLQNAAGPSVQAVTTTAQIYDLGPVANGNYTYTLKNALGVPLNLIAFSVSSAVPPANPIDDQRQFVRQQYLDFLSRDPDQAGWDFWTDNITRCNDPARRPPGQTVEQCTLRQRETTSAAFFLSPEFQYTAYYVHRVYQGALGRPPKLSEFTPDAAFVGNGIIVGGQLSAAIINQNKVAFAAQFVNCTDGTKSRCAEFKAIYDGLSNQAYVDRLFQNTGVNAGPPERAALVQGLNGLTETRATVLQKVVDGIVVIAEGNQQFATNYGQIFYNSEFNRAFVEFEYFGYMRRDPDDAGYAFWLAKLNQFGGNFVNAEMVLAFISSPEYRARFGQP